MDSIIFSAQLPVQLEVPITNPNLLKDLVFGQELFLKGSLIAARDQAHKRLNEIIAAGKPLPFSPQGQVIYYMGPSPAPQGRVIGAAGPTTAGRMDGLTIPLLELGVKGLLGKGKRSPEIQEALQRFGAVYFAAVGGAGAFYGDKIKKVEILAWPELGPEALLHLEVEEFPVMVVYDLKGGDLYRNGPIRWRS